MAYGSPTCWTNTPTLGSKTGNIQFQVDGPMSSFPLKILKLGFFDNDVLTLLTMGSTRTYYFKDINFRDFANFFGVRESLNPRNRLFSATRESLYPRNLTFEVTRQILIENTKKFKIQNSVKIRMKSENLVEISLDRESLYLLNF